MSLPPIARYEMANIARNPRSFLLRGLLVLAVLTGVYLTASQGDTSGGGDLFSSDRARDFFFSIWKLLVVILYLAVPAIAAASITREKERNTLGLVMMSGLSHGQIIIGKVMGRILATCLLVVCSAPLLIMLQALGGITWLDLLAMYVGLLGVAVLQAGVAIFAAARARTMAEALGMTYIILLLLAALFGIVAWGPLTLVGDWITQLQWLSVLASLEMQACIPLAEIPRVRPTHAFVGASLLLMANSLVSCVFLWLASRGLRLSVARGGTQWLGRIHAAYDSIFSRSGNAIRLVAMDRPIGTNPILWRETHRQALAHTGLQLRVFYIILVPLSFYVSLLFYDSRLQTGTWLWLLTTSYCVALVVALSVAAFSFASDRNRDRFAVLLTTPMPTWKIVVAKWAGACKSAMAMILFSIIALLGLVVTRGHVWLALWLTIMLGVALLLVVLDGLTASLKAPSPGRAISWALVGSAVDVMVCGAVAVASHRFAEDSVAGLRQIRGPADLLQSVQEMQTIDPGDGSFTVVLALLILGSYLALRVGYFMQRYRSWLLSDLA